MNIIVEVPKEIPDWFIHMSDELPVGFSRHTNIYKDRDEIISDVLMKRSEWANKNHHKFKGDFSSKNVDSVMLECPIKDLSEIQKKENQIIISQWWLKDKINRYTQWHKYYIDTFVKQQQNV